MNCETAREAISALLDGEHLAVERSELESHLDACATCREWREQAHEVTRRARLATARPVPAPDAPLLAAVNAINSRRSPWATLPLYRVVILLVGLAQMALALPELWSGSYRGAPIHVAHEMGALDGALAVGLLVAAWRPARAQGMRALVGCAALLLLVTATVDLMAGRTTISDEAPHLLVLAGWLLLRPIARLAPRDEGAGLPLRRLVRSRLERRRAWAVARWPSSGELGEDGNEAERPTRLPAEQEPRRRRSAEGERSPRRRTADGA